MSQGGFDVVIGADLVYERTALPPLFATAASLLAPGAAGEGVAPEGHSLLMFGLTPCQLLSDLRVPPLYSIFCASAALADVTLKGPHSEDPSCTTATQKRRRRAPAAVPRVQPGGSERGRGGGARAGGGAGGAPPNHINSMHLSVSLRAFTEELLMILCGKSCSSAVAVNRNAGGSDWGRGGDDAPRLSSGAGGRRRVCSVFVAVPPAAVPEASSSSMRGELVMSDDEELMPLLLWRLMIEQSCLA